MKNNISCIYVPPEDHKVWQEAEILSKLLGISRSKLICILLRKALENVNSPTEVSISNVVESISQRSREILYELSHSLKTA
jgi:antitoxin component of RelBE/YafQ-DinJ toxin-antitoxin module